LNIGRAFHFSGAHLLYWVRFLNAPISAVIVWLGYVAARLLDEDGYLRFTVPLSLALSPQTTFYSVTSDCLSPLCFGICFVGIIKLFSAKHANLRLAAGIGLSLA